MYFQWVFCRGVPPWAPLTAQKNGAPTEGRSYNFVKLGHHLLETSIEMFGLLRVLCL
jgi:hypothetical protein